MAISHVRSSPEEETSLQRLLRASVYICTKCGSSATELIPGLIEFSGATCANGSHSECGGVLRKLPPDQQVNWALHQWQSHEFGLCRHSDDPNGHEVEDGIFCLSDGSIGC